MENFGDTLYEAVSYTRGLLFTEGELANLTVISNNKFMEIIGNEEIEPINIEHPVGFNADFTPINSTKSYTREELINLYRFMNETKLPLDAIYRLVTITETLLNYILRNVLTQYPSKIPNKRKIDASLILEAENLNAVKFTLIDGLINEIGYKSPREYAEEFNHYVGINLLENPIYHRYIELKATRDIHIHNGGYANSIYLTKAGQLARVKEYVYLPVTIQYFLQSYESCLQLTEYLESELHKIWPSQKYLDNKSSLANKNKEEIIDEKIEEIIENAEKKKVSTQNK